MFNFDGQIVAGQLETYRWGDHFQRMRERRETITAADLERELSTLGQHYEQLAASYNKLVAQYNSVIKENERIDAAHSEVLAEKDREIAQLVADKEESRRSAYEGWTKLTQALEEIERLQIKLGEQPPA